MNLQNPLQFNNNVVFMYYICDKDGDNTVRLHWPVVNDFYDEVKKSFLIIEPKIALLTTEYQLIVSVQDYEAYDEFSIQANIYKGTPSELLIQAQKIHITQAEEFKNDFVVQNNYLLQVFNNINIAIENNEKYQYIQKKILQEKLENELSQKNVVKNKMKI